MASQRRAVGNIKRSGYEGDIRRSRQAGLGSLLARAETKRMNDATISNQDRAYNMQKKQMKEQEKMQKMQMGLSAAKFGTNMIMSHGGKNINQMFGGKPGGGNSFTSNVSLGGAAGGAAAGYGLGSLLGKKKKHKWMGAVGGAIAGGVGGSVIKGIFG